MAYMQTGQRPLMVPQSDAEQWQIYVPPPQQPTLGEIIVGGLLLFGGAYVAYKFLVEQPKPKRQCSACGRTSHTARNCPYVGDRRHFPRSVVKTGWCECCGYWFPKTQLHHWGGRSDDSRSMEMCGECHVHCGHDGHTQNFAIKPRYCRVA